MGHPGPVGRRSSHVRYAPKATVGHQNAIGRDGPQADIQQISKVCPDRNIGLLLYLASAACERSATEED
jgi:hypothetical protein